MKQTKELLALLILSAVINFQLMALFDEWIFTNIYYPSFQTTLSSPSDSHIPAYTLLAL